MTTTEVHKPIILDSYRDYPINGIDDSFLTRELTIS